MEEGKKWWIGNDDADPLLPKRDVEHEHQCVCDLVGVYTNGTVTEVHDRCMQSVFVADQPFCDDCERAGHPDLPQFERNLVTKTGATDG